MHQAPEQGFEALGKKNCINFNASHIETCLYVLPESYPFGQIVPQLIGVLKTAPKIAGRIHTLVALLQRKRSIITPMYQWKKSILGMSYRSESLPLPVVKVTYNPWTRYAGSCTCRARHPRRGRSGGFFFCRRAFEREKQYEDNGIKWRDYRAIRIIQAINSPYKVSVPSVSHLTQYNNRPMPFKIPCKTFCA
jgi:hypothetical protein